jgi:hypothetical protein
MNIGNTVNVDRRIQRAHQLAKSGVLPCAHLPKRQVAVCSQGCLWQDFLSHWRGCVEPRFVFGHLSRGERMVKPSLLGCELLGLRSSKRDGRWNERSRCRIRAGMVQSAAPWRARSSGVRGPWSSGTASWTRPMAGVAVRRR